MRLPLTTDRQKYYQLMALVCEDLATTAIDTLVRSGHEASSAQLMAVRQSRKIDLPWLIDLVEAGLPEFKVPAELRPAATLQPLFQ
jgi:hypothetical protein